jgi:hypothetical protein
MRILVDTNVLLRSAEPGHAHFQFSVEAIDLPRSHGHDLVLVPQILYEYWSVATRPLANNGFGLSPAEAKVELTMLRRLFRLLQDERGIYSMWHEPSAASRRMTRDWLLLPSVTSLHMC